MKISVLDTPTISTTITEIPTNITQKNIVQNKNSKNHPSTLVYFRIYIPDYIVSHNNIIKIPRVIRGVVFPLSLPMLSFRPQHEYQIYI